MKKIAQNNDKEQISKVSREKDLLPTMKQMLHTMTTWTKVWTNAEENSRFIYPFIIKQHLQTLKEKKKNLFAYNSTPGKIPWTNHK